jgi:hypothetical protein
MNVAVLTMFRSNDRLKIMEEALGMSTKLQKDLSNLEYLLATDISQLEYLLATKVRARLGFMS